MPFHFPNKTIYKGPVDIVKNLKDNITVLEKRDISDKKAEKVPHTRVLWCVVRDYTANYISFNHPQPLINVMCWYLWWQASEEVSKCLLAMKDILYGTNEKEPQTEAVAQLAQELYNSGLLSILVADLQLIDFEVCACAC